MAPSELRTRRPSAPPAAMARTRSVLLRAVCQRAVAECGYGAITGTHNTAATSNFTITATDGLGATGSRAYSVTINAAITSIRRRCPMAPSERHTRRRQCNRWQWLVSFSVSAGSLPAGLSLNAATGAITGTPTTAPRATSRSRRWLRCNGSRYSVTINPAITVNPATLPNGTVGTPTRRQSVQLAAMAHTFSVSAGSLPAGLSLNAATGAITGTPTTAATSTSRSLQPMAWVQPVHVLTASPSTPP